MIAPSPLSKGLRQGTGVVITRTPAGACVSIPHTVWAHPWQTTVIWWPAQSQWVALVRPGSVNGRVPFVRSTKKRMLATPTFLAPITAWDGAEDIARAAALATTTETDSGDKSKVLWVPLYRNPLINLPWKELTSIPGWFQRRGVNPTDGRKLMACDLVLHQPRTGLTSNVEFPGGLINGSYNVLQTLGLAAPSDSDRLKVESTSEWISPADHNSINPVEDDYTEATWDEKPIARVYLVSPPNPESGPDQTWVPVVQHHLFWNLCWHQPTFQPLPGDPGTPFVVPLAGGAAQLILNFYTASINDMTQRALNIITAHSMAGTFWTPTGGGSDASFPAAPVAVQKTDGLDKAARLAAKRAAKLATRTEPLDPAFPFNAIPFPANLLPK